jgi:host cell factor
MPGYPGAPSSIKITKGANACTHISWEPPQISCGPITEYSVYLSVKASGRQGEEQAASAPQKRPQLSFVQIYCGAESSCLIAAEVLAKANVDYSSKPAILFRIAAKNDKGYGPATQVRWLQGEWRGVGLMSNMELLSIVPVYL